MLVDGSLELFGKDGLNFLTARNSVEKELINMGYNYFYGGILSKREIYEKNSSLLGSSFGDIIYNLDGKEKSTILSPEGTFRVYEYLNRNGLLKSEGNRVFYSQEFIRNESKKSINKGKTRSFWQIGYELFGNNEDELIETALKTLKNCLGSFYSKKLKIRLADKRILKGLISHLSDKEIESIYLLMDECSEDGRVFYQKYILNGGDKKLAQIIMNVFEMFEGFENTATSFDKLHSIANNSLSSEGINHLEKLYKSFSINTDIRVETVPYIAKTWNAYTTLLFDAWFDDYNYAIAGGGSLHNSYNDKEIYKCGAGIGLTRIVEYINKNTKILNREEVLV